MRLSARRKLSKDGWLRQRFSQEVNPVRLNASRLQKVSPESCPTVKIFSARGSTCTPNGSNSIGLSAKTTVNRPGNKLNRSGGTKETRISRCLLRKATDRQAPNIWEDPTFPITEAAALSWRPARGSGTTFLPQSTKTRKKRLLASGVTVHSRVRWVAWVVPLRLLHWLRLVELWMR